MKIHFFLLPCLQASGGYEKIAKWDAYGIPSQRYVTQAIIKGHCGTPHLSAALGCKKALFSATTRWDSCPLQMNSMDL